MIDLRKIGIFAGLAEHDLGEIEPRARVEKRKKKEAVFSEGDPPDWFYVVLDGKVKITKLSQEGKEIILEVIPSGDFFGGVAVVRGMPFPANAVAMEDSTILKISREDFLSLTRKFPSVLQAVFRELGGRLQESHESMKQIALEKVISRVAALLLKLSEKAGKKTPRGIAIELKLTKQDIAEMVGTTVETSIRTMSSLKKQGIVEEKEGRIIIKDPARLKNLSA
jgi:CRP/FNR family transcriptional regulator